MPTLSDSHSTSGQYSYLVRCCHVVKQLFDVVLGASVRVRTAAGWMLLVDGQVLRNAVDGGRAREDDVKHLKLNHHLPDGGPHLAGDG